LRWVRVRRNTVADLSRFSPHDPKEDDLSFTKHLKTGASTGDASKSPAKSRNAA
jgi:hypothetical protein